MKYEPHTYYSCATNIPFSAHVPYGGHIQHSVSAHGKNILPVSEKCVLIKLMRRFYEAWMDLETNSVVASTTIPQATVSQLPANSVDASTELQKAGSEPNSVRQLQLTTDDTFPITAFLNISFSHHVAIFRYAETYDERKYYIQQFMEDYIKSLPYSKNI